MKEMRNLVVQFFLRSSQLHGEVIYGIYIYINAFCWYESHSILSTLIFFSSVFYYWQIYSLILSCSASKWKSQVIHFRFPSLTWLAIPYYQERLSSSLNSQQQLHSVHKTLYHTGNTILLNGCGQLNLGRAESLMIVWLNHADWDKLRLWASCNKFTNLLSFVVRFII